MRTATPIPSLPVIECVVNISEGRHPDVVEAVAAACGPVLLDVHTDPDHHRSVLTLAAPPGVVGESALALARTAVTQIDLSGHAGVHPRLGAVDVVPFVPLGAGGCAGAADKAAGGMGQELAGEVARAWG